MDYQLIESDIPQNNLTAVERVLTNRGIKIEDISHYLNTTDNDILSPTLLKNIKLGAQILIQHISKNDQTLIIVDSDVDGFTSSSILLNYLNILFPAYTQNKITYALHKGKEHGLEDMVSLIKNNNYKLVICPDGASADYEIHKQLKQQNIDVLILDHHEAEQESEYACVINNQLCNYPTKSLSGAGIVYKFCQYIDEIMNMDYADCFLDLVMLGLVADMMDLRDFETKHLIHKGLAEIHNSFISKMIERNSYSLGSDLTPMGIAFYVAPYINATVRMGTLKEKQIMFEAMLDFRAHEEIPSTKRGCKDQTESKVDQAVRNCINIKSRQTKSRDNALENIELILQKHPEYMNNKILVIPFENNTINRNLTGLIANQLMSKYKRPIILLHPVEHKTEAKKDGKILMVFDEGTTWEGSARGYDKSDLTDFKKLVNDSNCAMYAEGHANAFGCGFKDFSSIINFLNYSNLELKNYTFNPFYMVDFIFQANDFNGTDIIEIAELKSLWGQGVDEPYIALENVKVKKDNIILMSADKNPTLKITLPNGTSLIKFKSSKEEFESLQTEGVITLNIIGKCERNVWNGRVSPQIIIEDYEIINQIDYYF